MSLVTYSDSGSENEVDEDFHQDKFVPAKRKADQADVEPRPSKPPPLPLSFRTLYTTATRTSTSDDPSLHAGRTRQIPHVVGHWPTHLYLEWYPVTREQEVLEDLIHQARLAISQNSHPGEGGIYSFVRSDLGAPLPLHVSLSAPLVLDTAQKEPFRELLEAKLETAQVTTFETHVVGLKWFANKDKSRFFLVLELSKPEHDELNQLLRLCNLVARHHGLEQLYLDRESTEASTATSVDRDIVDLTSSFHISIGWTLREPSDGGQLPMWHGDIPRLKVEFHLLKLKMGNTVTDFPLMSKSAS